jgi:hypothetical protein
MALGDFFDKLKKEAKVLQGEEARDKIYSSSNTYPDPAAALRAYRLSEQKLFDVNRWSDLPGINSTFALYDQYGRRVEEGHPNVGYYLLIDIPGPTPENWVRVTEITQEEGMAQFTVHPSERPKAKEEGEEAVEHFFAKEASSTFRVELRDTTLWAYEIGKNEYINNQGEEAGDRALVNTLVAEGGWAGFQKMQWEKLTRYLVHLEEAAEPEENQLS